MSGELTVTVLGCGPSGGVPPDWLPLRRLHLAGSEEQALARLDPDRAGGQATAGRYVAGPAPAGAARRLRAGGTPSSTRTRMRTIATASTTRGRSISPRAARCRSMATNGRCRRSPQNSPTHSTSRRRSAAPGSGRRWRRTSLPPMRRWRSPGFRSRRSCSITAREGVSAIALEILPIRRMWITCRSDHFNFLKSWTFGLWIVFSTRRPSVTHFGYDA